MMEYKVYKWSDVLTIINGRNQNAVECEDGEYPIYGSGGVMGKANDYLCPPNCTIIGRKGNINKPIYVETKFWNVDTAFGLSANEEILNPRYLYYFCIDYNFERHNKAVTIPSLTKAYLLKIEMCLPPLDKQKSIVGELDKINELISLKKEQLKDYDNLAQSIFYEMFGDPVVNEKGWIVKTIGDVCSLKSGDSKANKSPKGTLPYVKVGDMNLPGNENYITCSSTYVDRDYNKRGIFPIGSILFPKRGGAILTNKKRMAAVEICCDLNTMGVIPSEVLNKHYLFQWFKILDLGTICSGSTILQLNNCDIAPLLIQIPPLTLQQTFAKRIELIEQQKAEIQSTIADLETLLASRMQYWFD